MCCHIAANESREDRVKRKIDINVVISHQCCSLKSSNGLAIMFNA
jgi:hypothetical protein